MPTYELLESYIVALPLVGGLVYGCGVGWRRMFLIHFITIISFDYFLLCRGRHDTGCFSNVTHNLGAVG